MRPGRSAYQLSNLLCRLYSRIRCACGNYRNNSEISCGINNIQQLSKKSLSGAAKAVQYASSGAKERVTQSGQVTQSRVPIGGMRLPRWDKEAEMVLFIKLDTFELKLELTTALLLTLLSVLLH